MTAKLKCALKSVGYSPAAPPPQVKIKENTDVVDNIAGKVLSDLPFN